MAEWLKAQHWKCCLGETLTRVRIPLSPLKKENSKSRASRGFFILDLESFVLDCR